MSVAVCILAKNEAKCIAATLADLARQSIVTAGAEDIEVHVVANGCNDDTATIARRSENIFKSTRVTLYVHDLQPGGKSRAWNRAVHELVQSTVEFFFFIDADVTFVSDQVLDQLLAQLKESAAVVCSGYPIKHISAKSRKSPLDLFSLAVSKRNRQAEAINGSLYVARATALRDIWLPDQTPGEDGFLNAMVTTCGFTVPPQAGSVIGAARPTHYYRAHGPLEFYLHERRMIVGTMINIWIFEHLWSLKLTSPAGSLIRSWNGTEPDWVEMLIRRHAGARRWLVRNKITFGRLVAQAASPWWKQIAHLPIAVTATILTIPPAIAANRILKQLGAARTW